MIERKLLVAVRRLANLWRFNFRMLKLREETCPALLRAKPPEVSEDSWARFIQANGGVFSDPSQWMQRGHGFYLQRGLDGDLFGCASLA